MKKSDKKVKFTISITESVLIAAKNEAARTYRVPSALIEMSVLEKIARDNKKE